MKNDNYIIVIGRQYGSGGRKIGKAIAEVLDIPFFDKQLLAKASKDYGFSSKIFEMADEKRPSLFHSLLQYAYGVTSTNINPSTLSKENLYKAQSQVIRRISETGSCVIVGRTADYVMRDHPNLISVFIHAPIGHRSKAVLARKEAGTLEEAAEIALRNDRERKSYYDYFTGRKWGQADNYDLCVNSALLPSETIARIILDYLDKRLNARKNTL